MKTIKHLIYIFFASILSGCIWFESVEQDESVLREDPINVAIEVFAEVNNDTFEYETYFGVCLPVGWDIPGDSIQYEGIFNGTIYFDDFISEEQENISPSPEGYYWWVGKESRFYGYGEGMIYGNFQIQTDYQVGLFSLDYMLGNSFDGLNHERSNGHLTVVVDEYTPRNFHAVVEENEVILNWQEPLINEDLLGYMIYRDEQVINSMMIVDTTYTDEDPVSGVHYYAVSSLYNDGSEHLLPFELPVIFGDFYVSPEGSNENSGLSFDDAFLTISYAMSVISLDPSYPITIFLAPGIYSSSTNGEEFPVTPLNYVSIIGSGENETILDAENQENVSVMKLINIQVASLKDFTITNGTANNGGGIHCVESSPNLENILITNNSAGDNFGGGIYCLNSSPNFVNVTISNNTSGCGGGVFSRNSCSSFTGMTIENNTAENGGGIFCDESSDLELSDVTISYNCVSGNGAGIYCSESILDLSNVTLTHNTGENSGGGIYCDSSDLIFDPDNRSNIYLNNFPINNGYGADIYATDCEVIHVIVDTFTVLTPTEYYAFPVTYFTFDINHSIHELIDSDLYVSPAGDNSNSGTSPDDPFRTISHALYGIAPDSLTPNTIHILPGIYSPATNQEVFPIYLSSHVYLEGSGEEETILDADHQNTVLYFEQIANAMISNLTIMNGYGGYEGCGGGIHCINNSSPCLINVTVSGNNASLSGGGIFCNNNSSPHLENVDIINNSVSLHYGGGIYCSNNSSPVLINVTISENYADDSGGGIYCTNNSSPHLENVDIINNSVFHYYGGGIYCSNNSNTVFTNVTISGNNATRGGGIYINDYDNLYIEDVAIISNTAVCGGGIYSAFSDETVIDNSIFLSNYATENGGGIYIRECSNLKILNTKFIDNSTEEKGAGIYILLSNPYFFNTVINGNHAYDMGGGIYLKNSAAGFVNVSLADNSADVAGGGISCYNANQSLTNCILWNDFPQEIQFSQTGSENSLEVLYSDIQGGEEGIITNDNGTVYWLDGNLDEDPLFTGTGEDPYSLLEESPCIDTGIPDTTGLNLPPCDIMGNQRIWDGDGDGIAYIDMGAYEFGSLPYVAVEENVIVQIPGIILHQNFPNPFNPETVIKYQLAEESYVDLSIFSIKGQLVKKLVAEFKTAGEHAVVWNGDDNNQRKVPSGIYLYRLKTKAEVKIRKMILLK